MGYINIPVGGGGGGGDISPNAFWTAKGDIAVATGAGVAIPLPVGGNGQVLVANSAQPSGVQWTSVGGTGDVVGPASSTDNAVARFDLTTGKLLQNTANCTIADSGEVTSASLTASRVLVAGTGKEVQSSSVTTTTLGYLDATSSIQTQLNAKQASDATLTALAAYNTNGLMTQTAADTFTGRTLTGGGGVTVTNGDGVAGNPTLSISNLRTIWIPATAMRPSATGGCAPVVISATTANQPDLAYLAFDPSTIEYAQFQIRFPKAYNNGTITAAFYWSHPATTVNFGVVWSLQGVAEGDNTAIATAYGTAQDVTDTGGTTNNLYISASTSAITLAGTPADGKLVQFRASRNATSGSDTLAVDAYLTGIAIFYTVNTLDDA